MIGILVTTGKKTLSLCVLAGVAATLVTFSQDALPMHREITDTTGKKLQGTVLEVTRAATVEYQYPNDNDNRKYTMLTARLAPEERARVENATDFPITFSIGSYTVEAIGSIKPSIRFLRWTDQQEFNIPLSKLSEEDRKWVASLPYWEHPTPGKKQPKALEWEGAAVRRDMTNMSTSDIQKMLKARDYKTETWLAEQAWGSKSAQTDSVCRYESQVPHILALTPNEADEKVSLRQEFEKAGIKSIAQTPNACTFYSGYSLYQYLVWKNGMETIPFEQFLATAKSFEPKWPADMRARDPHIDERFSDFSIIRAGLKLRGIHPTIIPFASPNNNVRVDLMKHFLKKGYPLWGSIFTKTGVGHAVLFTGFTTSNGKTRFEVLESKGPGYGDGGYELIDSNIVKGVFLLTVQ